MAINSPATGFLRGEIVLQDRTIGRDFLKFLQNTDTHTSELYAFAVAKLPQKPKDGTIAFASDGRKQGEGQGHGTGVPVYFSAGQWRRYSDDTQVQA